MFLGVVLQFDFDKQSFQLDVAILFLHLPKIPDRLVLVENMPTSILFLAVLAVAEQNRFEIDFCRRFGIVAALSKLLKPLLSVPKLQDRR